MSYQISREQFEATVAKVEKANARAAKKGLAGLLTITGTPVLITTTDNLTGLDRTVEKIEVEFGGEAPKFEGWTFVAVLDWDQNAGLIVRTAPGITEAVDRSKLVDGYCDHCTTNRYRKETYLLRHDNGLQVQVGSTCIKDFLGLEVNVAWLDSASVSSEFDGKGSWAIDHGTEYVLALAWAMIKLEGWKPSNFDGSTKGNVFKVLYPPRVIDEEYRAWAGRVRYLAEEAKERAAEVRAFILSDEFSGTSDYVINLKAIVRADSVTDRNIGFLVSAPQALAKHQSRTLIQEAKAAEVPSEWVGAVKDKVAVTATIKSIRFIPSDFGITTLYTLRDTATGNIFKWFASREALGDKTEVEVKVTATVKGHEEYNGVKSTLITRAKLVA